jgi:myo-inositol-1(or 4)-monophosphatase
MPDLLTVCLEAAHRGGEILLDWQHRFRAKEKSPKDLVTEADLASQEAIRAIIHKAFPDHDFLGEEDAADRKARGQPPLGQRKSNFRWIVDPLDGTVNYVHRLPGYAVSIALQDGDDLEVGVVYDPLSRECYVGQRGQKPTLNGQPIATSGCERPEQALIAVSFSSNVPRGSIEITRFIEALHSCQSIRRMGSAALNLCYVASGRLDAYWATSIAIWDIAAGMLILQEAGGRISALDGAPLVLEKPLMIAAASSALQGELIEILARADRTHQQQGWCGKSSQ